MEKSPPPSGFARCIKFMAHWCLPPGCVIKVEAHARTYACVAKRAARGLNGSGKKKKKVSNLSHGESVVVTVTSGRALSQRPRRQCNTHWKFRLACLDIIFFFLSQRDLVPFNSPALTSSALLVPAENRSEYFMPYFKSNSART